MSVVLDSNILISGFRFKGKPRQLMDMGLAGDLDIVISPSIAGEVVRILRDKFHYTPDQLNDAREIMQEFRMVEPSIKLNVVEDDPNDDHVVETAVTAGTDVIITGDNHLLRMGEYQGIRVMRVGEFLERGR